MGFRKQSLAAVVAATFCFAGPALAETLLQDGQIIIFTGTSGIKKGDTNRHIYEAEAGTLGPVRRPARANLFKVLKNTASQVVFKGPRDTCVLSSDHTFACPKIGNGTWKVE